MTTTAAAIMDLFDFADAMQAASHAEIASVRRTARIKVPRYCSDCGAEITEHSRGRCETCAYAAMRKPAPDDLAAVLRRLGSCGAAKHYKSSLSTVTRWRREIGMSKHERARVTRRPAYQGFKPAPFRAVRDFSIVGQAADFLRRFGPVSRCGEDGKYPKRGVGQFWNRNGYVLTDDELMAKARRLGWEPVGM